MKIFTVLRNLPVRISHYHKNAKESNDEHTRTYGQLHTHVLSFDVEIERRDTNDAFFPEIELEIMKILYGPLLSMTKKDPTMTCTEMAMLVYTKLKNVFRDRSIIVACNEDQNNGCRLGDIG